MKELLLLITILTIIGYNQQKQQPKSNNTNKLISDTIKPFLPPTTELPIQAVRQYPSTLELDSINYTDTTVSHHVVLYFPKSRSNDDFNKSIRAYLENYTKQYVPEKTKDPFQSSSLDIWINSFQISGQLISCCFTDQSFYDGAAHYNHGYTTFNYDLEKKKQIFFTDLFKFSKKKTKQSFCEYAGFNGGGEGVNPTDLKKNTDFYIADKKLILCFDDYEKGPSMTTYEIELHLIQKYINPNLGKELGLIINQ